MALALSEVRAIVQRVCARPDVLAACHQHDIGFVVEVLGNLAPASLEAFACRMRLIYHAFLLRIVVFLVFFGRCTCRRSAGARCYTSQPIPASRA